MELRELETFRAVATLLSVSRAAESLNYAQSTVTAQIQSIEREFEVPLFDRLGKRLRLAEGGRRLLDYADRMLRLADEARAAVNGHEPTTGTISIGATESLCAYRLPNVIQVFRGRFPAARVRLHSGIGSALRRRLGDGSIDMAFLMQGTAQDNDLVVEELMVEKLVVIAAPGHRHANRRKLNFSELDGETVLATERGRSYRETFEHALERAGARPAVTLEFGSIEAIKHCVMADVGIAILPEVAVREELARGSLASLDIQGPAFTIVTQMAWHRDKHVTSLLAAFADIARAKLGAVPRP